MLSGNEIQQRYSQIETAVHQAAQRCESTRSVPMDLKDVIQKLEQETSRTRDVIQSQDENQIRQCIDDMEDLGDRAKAACQDGVQVDRQLQDAVMQVHQQLSDLKHQLH